ncbi:hypothetical protein SNEBB_006851 [Seison nebaliae]|nr:hypothetical protein SNEBB_006851 [Seison nebaliae]
MLMMRGDDEVDCGEERNKNNFIFSERAKSNNRNWKSTTGLSSRHQQMIYCGSGILILTFCSWAFLLCNFFILIAYPLCICLTDKNKSANSYSSKTRWSIYWFLYLIFLVLEISQEIPMRVDLPLYWTYKTFFFIWCAAPSQMNGINFLFYSVDVLWDESLRKCVFFLKQQQTLIDRPGDSSRSALGSKVDVSGLLTGATGSDRLDELMKDANKDRRNSLLKELSKHSLRKDGGVQEHYSYDAMNIPPLPESKCTCKKMTLIGLQRTGAIVKVENSCCLKTPDVLPLQHPDFK